MVFAALTILLALLCVAAVPIPLLAPALLPLAAPAFVTAVISLGLIVLVCEANRCRFYGIVGWAFMWATMLAGAMALVYLSIGTGLFMALYGGTVAAMSIALERTNCRLPPLASWPWRAMAARRATAGDSPDQAALRKWRSRRWPDRYSRRMPRPSLLAPLPPTALPQTLARVLLGAMLLFTGTGHLTFARQEFVAQVPSWVPFGTDFVVVASGIVEIALGLALALLGARRVPVGLIVAAFFIAVFPGNISQYTNQTTAFGLDTDAKRLARLFMQPVLVAWALWSTGAWAWLRDRK